MKKTLMILVGLAYCAVSLIPWVMMEPSPWRLVSGIAILPILIPLAIFSWFGDVKITKATIWALLPSSIQKLWSGN